MPHAAGRVEPSGSAVPRRIYGFRAGKRVVAWRRLLLASLKGSHGERIDPTSIVGFDSRATTCV